MFEMKLSIYDNLKHIVAQLTKIFHIKLSIAKTGRPRKISGLDSLTLALYQHASTRNTKKSVYDDFKDRLKCSYKTLVCALNESGLLAMKLLFCLMRLNKRQAHLIKYTDSTDLPVCLRKNADKHKVMKDLASFGYSAKGWYYGLKLTLTRDCQGRMLGLKITSPKKSDREIFKDINADLDGIIVADAGYVSKKLEREMNEEGRRWILIRPLKSMKRLATFWQLEIYKGRFQIEFDFRSLKMFFGLVTSLPRSINGYLNNYLHSLLAFALR